MLCLVKERTKNLGRMEKWNDEYDEYSLPGLNAPSERRQVGLFPMKKVELRSTYLKQLSELH